MDLKAKVSLSLALQISKLNSVISVDAGFWIWKQNAVFGSFLSPYALFPPPERDIAA
jgi:hypothetical protein